MFENLTEKLDNVFRKLKGRGVLDEESVSLALKDIRIALLEADVNFKVTKNFIQDVKGRAVGREVLESITPGQQVVKIVHDRLIELMGGDASQLRLANRFPAPIMLVGLQGCGKTTTAAKIARYLMNQKKRVSLVSADVYRPAATDQLSILAEKTGARFFHPAPDTNPVKIAVDALNSAKTEGYDILIIDTAGRLHIDTALMDELKHIKEAVNPTEILFVADAMTGQDAVSTAERFNELLDVTGVILTKVDGDARGGAALSIRAVTGRQVKFIGIGEKLDAIEVFHPDRMASRILGQGDVLTLVEKAQMAYDEKTARDLEKKIRKDSFTLEDFRDQLIQIRKMGPLEDLLAMIPGFGKMKAMKNVQVDEGEFVKIIAIIDSMTNKERFDARIINGSRRKRIARGSGTTVQDVNRLLKNYLEMRKMMKKLTKGGGKQFKRGKFPFK